MSQLSGNEPYIICPVCNGGGRNNLGMSCANCGGLGMGKFFHGRFFYWAPRLGIAMIELSRVKKKIHFTINLISFIISFGGLIAVGFWIFSLEQSGKMADVLDFWKTKHVLLLFFWFGIAAAMFIYYRICEEERRRHKIAALSYAQKKRKHELPNNWEELRRSQTGFRVDVAGGFDIASYDAVEKAFQLAEKLHHEHVTPLHLLFSVLPNQEVAAIFSRLNIPALDFLEKIKAQIADVPAGKGKTRLSKTVREALIEAYIDAYRLGQKKVSVKNLILPCLRRNHLIREILLDLEVDQVKIQNVILWFIINEKQVELYRKFRSMARFKPGSSMDRAYTAVATPILRQIGYDLTLAAKCGKLEFCVARDAEIEAVWQHFESGSFGAILVGPAGVGKKTVAGGIAQLMVEENVPYFLQDKRLVELDMARLISGASPSEAQRRLMAVLDEAMRAGNIVLFVNNVENLIGITSGAEESLDLSQVLAGAVERGGLYCICSSGEVNYSRFIEGTALGNVMPKVDIKEPLGNQAIQIVESKIGALEGKHKVYFAYSAIEQAVNMSVKYLHDKYLPEKAISILEHVAVSVLNSRGERAFADKNDVAEAISKMTNIPVTKITQDEGKRLLELENLMHERMVAQHEAVKLVAASLRRARTELRETSRPIANFLFLGPTGVGKTELAKTVSEVYFGKEEYMIRLDMSEYQHPDSVKKMIGTSSGAAGYLTERVRKSPFSLILLDEIEKAHKEILNLFLQVMDDGRLTDGLGRTIDFTNVIIIATANIGADYIQSEIARGGRVKDIKNVLINEHLKTVMRPELINRFDGIVVFHPLSLENVVAITKLMLQSISKMLEAKGINFRYEEGGARILAKQGFDQRFGARPLRRLLQEKVEDEIANLILAGKLKRRDTVVIGAEAEILVEKGIVI